jgi:hypothetical protein
MASVKDVRTYLDLLVRTISAAGGGAMARLCAWAPGVTEATLPGLLRRDARTASQFRKESVS